MNKLNVKQLFCDHMIKYNSLRDFYNLTFSYYIYINDQLSIHVEYPENKQ